MASSHNRISKHLMLVYKQHGGRVLKAEMAKYKLSKQSQQTILDGLLIGSIRKDDALR